MAHWKDGCAIRRSCRIFGCVSNRQPRFQTLTRALAEVRIGELIALAADVDAWGTENFLFELPGKWDLSFLAEDEGLLGYAILSRKAPDRVHLHHFMLGAAARGRGVGTTMLAEVRRRARPSRLTLKVHRDNLRAIAFYRREGFVLREAPDAYLWMEDAA